MIDLLGLVVFATIVGIGVLDGKSGLTLLGMYRSTGPTDLRRPAATSHGGEGNRPMPPTPAK